MSYLSENCKFSILRSSEDIKGFSCGDTDLDEFFSNDCFDKLKNILTKEKLGYDITDEKSDVVLYRIRIYKDISDNIHYLNNEYYQKYTLPGNGFDRAAGFEYIGDSCKLQVNTDFISERDELAEESGGYIYVDETMQARREFYKVLNIIMDSEEV